MLPDRGLIEVALVLGDLEGAQCEATTIAALMWAAEAEGAVAREAFQLCSEWLGVVAGDLTLTAGARSGVYLLSPMISSWSDHFD